MINLEDFILTSRLSKTFQADELLFVKYECLEEEPRSEIWSQHNYFVYVLGGKKKWKTQENEYVVRSGDVIFVRKGAYSVFQYLDEQFFVLFVFLPDEFITYVLEKHIAGSLPKWDNEYGPPVIPLEKNAVLEAYFQSLLTYFTQSEAPPKSLLKLKMEELILNILATGNNPEIKHYFTSLLHTGNTSLMEIMETNYTNPLSIAEYARLCTMSPSTFKRAFKRHYQEPPGKWLREKRLQYSRFLLETSDKNLDDIVYDSGLKNRSHFIRIFREKYGITPGEYRRETIGV